MKRQPCRLIKSATRAQTHKARLILNAPGSGLQRLCFGSRKVSECSREQASPIHAAPNLNPRSPLDLYPPDCCVLLGSSSVENSLTNSNSDRYHMITLDTGRVHHGSYLSISEEDRVAIINDIYII